MSVCRHCQKVFAARSPGRGLCWACHRKPAVRELYATLAPGPAVGYEREPTEEDLDRLIAERMQCLPDWWELETERERERVTPLYQLVRCK